MKKWVFSNKVLFIFLIAFLIRFLGIFNPYFGVNKGEVIWFSFVSNWQVIYLGRFLALLLGLISLVFCFKIIKMLFPENKNRQLLFLFVLAINPQFVFLSRFTTLLGLSFFFVVLAVYLLVRARQKHSWILCLLAFLFLFFSLFSWFSFNRQVDFLPAWEPFGIFSDIGIINAINDSRGAEIEFGIQSIARLLYNKSYYFVFWLSSFVKQYSLNHIFSLVENNGTSLLFENTPMLLIFAPFFVFGFFKSFEILSYNKAFVLLIALVAGGLPSSLLSSSFVQDAFIFALLPISFYVVLGLEHIWKKKLWQNIFILLLIANILVSYYKIIDDFKRTEKLPNQRLYSEFMEAKK